MRTATVAVAESAGRGRWVSQRKMCAVGGRALAVAYVASVSVVASGLLGGCRGWDVLVRCVKMKPEGREGCGRRA